MTVEMLMWRNLVLTSAVLAHRLWVFHSPPCLTSPCHSAQVKSRFSMKMRMMMMMKLCFQTSCSRPQVQHICKFAFFVSPKNKTCTVQPLHNSHPSDSIKVGVVGRWLLWRGEIYSKIVLWGCWKLAFLGLREVAVVERWPFVEVPL